MISTPANKKSKKNVDKPCPLWYVFIVEQKKAKIFSCRLPEPLLDKLKLEAVKRHQKIYEFVREAIEEKFKKKSARN